MKTVSKEAFQRFLDSYPVKLESRISTVAEPPYRSYRDPRDVAPTMHVAGVSMEWQGPNGETDIAGDTYHQYRINDEHPVAADVIREIGD